jgi:hypothetical protein
MIDDATTDKDLQVPPSNHFEELGGNFAGLTRSASISAGGWYFGWTATGARRKASISTTIVIGEQRMGDVTSC